MDVQVSVGTNVDLTYCSNIHPARGWKAVYHSLCRHSVELKRRLSPDRLFGLGLRLSDNESRELCEPASLEVFTKFLNQYGFYVFTINGFVFGDFHNTQIKESVHSPDWAEKPRLEYTLRLVEILGALLPEGKEGSISTSPISYKPWRRQSETNLWEAATANLIHVAERLYRIKQERGVLIYLAIEPEPDGTLETSIEVVEFYSNYLLSIGAKRLAVSLSVSSDEAARIILSHLRICFDCCHVALEYERPAEVIRRFEPLGIRVGKIQVSSALKILFPKHGCRERIREVLHCFHEDTYLHQVLQRNVDGSFKQYPDLGEALCCLQDSAISEWRVHFHIPIHVKTHAGFASTQSIIEDTIEILKKKHFCRHLEIETYTWNVLPGGLKRGVVESIEDEYRWLLQSVKS